MGLTPQHHIKTPHAFIRAFVACLLFLTMNSWAEPDIMVSDDHSTAIDDSISRPKENAISLPIDDTLSRPIDDTTSRPLSDEERQLIAAKKYINIQDIIYASEEDGINSLGIETLSDADYLTVEEIMNNGVTQSDATAAQQKTTSKPAPQKIEYIALQKKDNETPNRESLGSQMQDLKNAILSINRDLLILEEDLLFPSNTQYNVFVSYDAEPYFSVDGITLKLNDKPVSNFLYTERDIKALKRGAVQRLHVGNLPTGDHELVAVVTGQGPEGRTFRRAIDIGFSKHSNTKYIELQIQGNDKSKQPTFHFKEWE